MANKTIDELDDGGTLQPGDVLPIFRTDKTQRVTFGTFQQTLVDTMWPVGSIFISTISVNPETYMTGTSWVAYSQGRVLVGVGTGTDNRSVSETFNMGGTGGEYSHVLEEPEMPVHDHGYSYQYFSDNNHPDKPLWGKTYDCPDWKKREQKNDKTDTAGGSQPHENMPPYIVVYMWRRMA